MGKKDKVKGKGKTRKPTLKEVKAKIEEEKTKLAEKVEVVGIKGASPVVGTKGKEEPVKLTEVKAEKRASMPKVALTFEALRERIKSRKDTTIEDLINTLLLKGGKKEDILKAVQGEVATRGLKIYSQGSAQFNSTLQFRRKKGWVIEEDEKGFVKLVGLEEKK